MSRASAPLWIRSRVMLSSHRLCPRRWSHAVGLTPGPPCARARGKMICSTAFAKPSSAWDVVTNMACVFSVSGAFPIAMLTPARASIGRSLS